MLDSQQQEYLDRFTTTVQIIIGALAFGVLAFAIVVILMQPEQADADESGINSLMAAGAAVVALLMLMVVPKILQSNMRQSIVDGNFLVKNIPAPVATELGDFGSLTAMYQVTLIVGAAILEGAAFYNLIAYMLEHQSINLLFAVGLLIAILFKFPTRGGIESWINDEQTLIAELRAFKE